MTLNHRSRVPESLDGRTCFRRTNSDWATRQNARFLRVLDTVSRRISHRLVGFSIAAVWGASRQRMRLRERGFMRSNRRR